MCPREILHSLPRVWTLLVPVALCMFLQNLMFNISFGCCRHSVSNTFVQLTEGRSARDQPKQPPAKKVPPGFRNDVLRGKQVIIGCGGGFHQECSQPYSPVAKWMREVDMALNDEGQQYGNLDESSAIARVPRKEANARATEK